MIQNELLRWEAPDKFDSSGKLASIYKDVVSEIVPGKSGHTSKKVLPHHEAIIVLRLNDMSESPQFGVAGEAFQPLIDILVQQVHPSHYAGNRRIFLS